MEDVDSEEGHRNRELPRSDPKMGEKNLLVTNKGHVLSVHRDRKTFKVRTRTQCFDEVNKPEEQSAPPATPKNNVYPSLDFEELKSCLLPVGSSKGDLAKSSSSPMMETEDKTPQRRTEYDSIKDSVDPLARTKKIFSNPAYLADISEETAEQSAHRFQAYRYRAETLASSALHQDCAKDLSLYSSIALVTSTAV